MRYSCCDAVALQRWYFCTWGFTCPSVVTLNINIRICIHWKQQTAQKRWQSGICGSAGFTEQTSPDLSESSTLHYYLQFSVEKWNWVTGITLEILYWDWLNGRYYLKNKFIPGETWQSCNLGIEWEEKRIGENLMERPVSVSNLPNVAAVEPHYK